MNDNDRVFDQDEFKIVISKDFDGLYKNLEVEYINNFLGEGFTVAEKGKAASSCC